MVNGEMRSRLEFAQFDSSQRARLCAAQDRIADLISPALDRFYETAKKTPETARFFRDAAHMAGAKRAQMAHWAHLVTGRFDEDYYDSVRRIGERHAVIGLEPRWYIGAYILVIEELMRGLGKSGVLARLGGDATETLIAVVKAVLIDVELSVTVYFDRCEAAQKQIVDVLERGLAQLASGDLANEITETVDPAYERLKSNYNAALGALRELIGSVIQGSGAISTGAGEIAQASENLARRTEANAASLEETTAAVAQMDQRLRATASDAAETLGRADGARRSVSDGRVVVDEAVQAMGRVSESAKGIDSVIEGLDKIAFQTRVLAMNAAVEAGRAGEAGRGFAVVADLVSALAMRAEEEAGRARDQLTATQVDVTSAVEMVRRVDGALSSISEEVASVHRLLGDIASANQAQAQAISEISTAVSAMDTATQQNAAMVEEASAASRALASESTTLSDQAQRFSIGAAARSIAAPRAHDSTPTTGAVRVSVRAIPQTADVAAGDWASF